MEIPDRPERIRRPELDQYDIDGVFDYARDKQRWLKERVSDQYLGDTLDYLANELDQHVSNLFEEGPQIEIQASIVSKPLLSYLQQDRYQIEGILLDPEIESVQLGTGDNVQSLSTHSLSGTLYGFHYAKVFDTNQLCVYLARDEPLVKLPAGIYKPLWSVPIEGSEIHFVREREVELLRTLGGFVTALEKERSVIVNDILKDLLILLDNNELSIVDRLRRSEVVLAFIMQQEGLPEHFSDTLLDIISHKLRLSIPVSVHVMSHRIITSTPVVKSYNQGGEKLFDNVVPQLALMGESAQRSLGLFFYDSDDAVRVFVGSLKSIYRTEP